MLSATDEERRGADHETSGKHTGHLLPRPVLPDGGAAGAGGDGGGVRRDPHGGAEHPHHFSRLHLPRPDGRAAAHCPPLEKPAGEAGRHRQRLSGLAPTDEGRVPGVRPAARGGHPHRGGSGHGRPRAALQALCAGFSAIYEKGLPAGGRAGAQPDGGLPADGHALSGRPRRSLCAGAAAKAVGARSPRGAHRRQL